MQKEGGHVPFWTNPTFSHICAHSTKHKPSAASFSDESHPVTRAGCLGHQQGKYVPRTSPSENTERSWNFNLCTDASMPLEKINQI